jgi:hypothetical protein
MTRALHIAHDGARVDLEAAAFPALRADPRGRAEFFALAGVPN